MNPRHNTAILVFCLFDLYTLGLCLKLRRRVHSDVTELNRPGLGLVFDELTNGQAVMHYISHRLTASVTM